MHLPFPLRPCRCNYLPTFHCVHMHIFVLFFESNAANSPMQRENDVLKAQLKQKEQQVEQTRAELRRRCTAFDCQLQSCCSECTAAVEEHVVTSLTSLKKRVENVHKDIDRFVSEKDTDGWKSGVTAPVHKTQECSSNKRVEGLDSALVTQKLQAPSHDDMEPSAMTESDKRARGRRGSPVPRSGSAGDSDSEHTRSPSVRHDAATLLS
jgi:hypothetical protein